MISSVTTAAFAAAKAVNDNSFFKSRVTDVFDEEDEDDLENEGTCETEKISGGFKDQVYQFLDSVTSAAENMNIGSKDASSFVDQDIKERIAHMIDSCKFYLMFLKKNFKITN